MKQIAILGLLAFYLPGSALGAVNQQDFDRDMILMLEQINELQSQIEDFRKMMDAQQLGESRAIQRELVEGFMMGGQMPQGADPKLLPDPQSQGVKLVNRYCTQCHGLPTPVLHSDIGWPPVINRMNIRMEWMNLNNSKMGIFAPTPAELKTITEYMQKNARVFPVK